MNPTDQLIQESEERIEKIGKFKSPSEFPYKRDVHGNPIERKSKAKCTFNGFLKTCPGDIYGNVDPTKIITCGNCVQLLLSISREEKIKLKNLFILRDLTEQARSVEAFIIPEDRVIDATFERTIVLRRSKHTLRGGKCLPRMSNRRI